MLRRLSVPITRCSLNRGNLSRLIRSHEALRPGGGMGALAFRRMSLTIFAADSPPPPADVAARTAEARLAQTPNLDLAVVLVFSQLG
jgi:hypothetical protein